MAARSESGKARELVRAVILAQSNVFIKELLRDKGIKGGATKADYDELLQTAIDDGVLTYDDLKAWVDDTEGWGDEHIYLYDLPKKIGSQKIWKSTNDVEDRIKSEKKFKSLWNADTSLKFPDQRTLTGIYFQDDELTFLWHQGADFEQRAKEKDYEQVDPEDDETYIYKAWRRVRKRNVARVVIHLATARVAVFLPGLLEPKTHLAEREAMSSEIGSVLPFYDFEIRSMADAIKTLDARAMQPGAPQKIQPRHTRLTTIEGGGSIDFASEGEQGYANIGPLRNVRLAVTAKDFAGNECDFLFWLDPANPDAPKAQERKVRVDLRADFHRIRIYMRLSRADVWTILDQIP